MPVRYLRKGLKGPDVKRWQFFLLGKGYTEIGTADSSFGDNTKAATERFQKDNGLDVDGTVGNDTMGKAMMLGFGLLVDKEETNGDGSSVAPNPQGINFPPRPDFSPLLSSEERTKLFGRFAYKPAPLPSEPRHVAITDGWDKKNIEVVEVPQLRGVDGAGAKPKASFHHSVIPQALALFKAWDDAALLNRVLSWGGAFNPRFQSGTTVLSNHAFGSAFDINVAWNDLGAVPALMGQKGCVRELVQIANQHGFYWGGHFHKRPDGMHFEVAKIM